MEIKVLVNTMERCLLNALLATMWVATMPALQRYMKALISVKLINKSGEKGISIVCHKARCGRSLEI